MKRKDREMDEKRGEEICNQYNWNYGWVKKVNWIIKNEMDKQKDKSNYKVASILKQYIFQIVLIPPCPVSAMKLVLIIMTAALIIWWEFWHAQIFYLDRLTIWTFMNLTHVVWTSVKDWKFANISLCEFFAIQILSS